MNHQLKNLTLADWDSAKLTILHISKNPQLMPVITCNCIFGFIAQGSGEWDLHHTPLLHHKNIFLIVHDPINIHVTQEPSSECLWIYCNVSFDNIVSEPLEPLIFYDAPKHWLTLIDNINTQWEMHTDASKYKTKLYLAELIYEMYTLDSNRLHEEQLTSQTLDYINKHFHENLSRHTIAEKMNYSVSYLSKQFKYQTGYGLIDYLLHTRIKHAKRLLVETHHSIQEVSKQIGYEDSSYFTRLFKKHTGLTPGQYKRLYLPNSLVLNNPNFELKSSDVFNRGPLYNDNCYQYEGGFLPMKFNWNHTIVASFVLCAALLLTACTNNDTTKESEETMVYHSINGDITYKKNPQRIVTDFYLGYLLALDVKPVGSNEAQLKNPYIPEKDKKEIEVIGDSIEKVLSLEPDLIITGNKEMYEQLSKIAPTIYIEYEENIPKLIKEFGIILNRENLAQEWQKNYQQQVQTARQKIARIIKPEETITVMDILDGKGTITIYGDGYTGYPVYTGLGLQMAPAVKAETTIKTPWVQISSEKISDFVGDRVIVARAADTPKVDFTTAPVWKSLDVVKNNEVYEIDNFKFWFTDPISVIGQMNDLTDLFIERANDKKTK